MAALKSGKGDCTDFSDLMVALCRAKGLPARSRICVVPDAIDTPQHAVLEVYLPEKGWVTFDPLWTKEEKRGREELPNRYLYFKLLRNDENLWNFFTVKGYWIYSENQVKDFETRLRIREKNLEGEWESRRFQF